MNIVHKLHKVLETLIKGNSSYKFSTTTLTTLADAGVKELEIYQKLYSSAVNESDSAYFFNRIKKLGWKPADDHEEIW